MASLGSRFDATAVDTTQREYENLPAGDYKLEVEKSDVGATSTGEGMILKLTYNVIEPLEYAGRKIFGNMNLENKNEQAQKIGQEQLASLCRAVGVDGIEDSEELHYKTFVAKVGLSKARTGKDGKVYEPRNEIKKFYFPDEGAVPEAKAAPQAANDNLPAANDNQPAPAVAPAKTARPWKS